MASEGTKMCCNGIKVVYIMMNGTLNMINEGALVVMRRVAEKHFQPSFSMTGNRVNQEKFTEKV